MDSGAKAAISGFRLQALYTLDLILHEAESTKEFQPEGKEDLAVYENGRLIRAIQVKAYVAPLKLSDLDPRKDGSFLRRLAGSGDEPGVAQLASFGPLGPELEAVRCREVQALAKLSEKLGEYGYSATEIATIVQRLEILRVDEAALRDRVYRYLTQTMTAGDPERAFDLLVWWVLKAAENRRRIAFIGLRDQLLAVGLYFAERKAHHDEWFTTIKPLEEWTATALPSATLAKEYYRGTAARYSHICADLDVRRTEQLEAVESYFRGNRKVVIIHGASGQGKTSLALRYLHDYVPSDWRFMVASIEDRRHAAKIANALADHLRAVNAPLWLFLDVAPRDLQWVALIRELLDIDNVRILVAIREEDLARRMASESEIGFPADIRLEFTAHDAANIYIQLVEQAETINAFPTFAEAWERFGGEGPLLEFVYLITQTESLRSVLASQVRRLREEVRSGVLEPAALRFLHICAVATSFEARINLAPLAAHLDLKDPAGTVALFENEFLLRVSTDRTQVEALHPVRSDLLAKELHDVAFAREEDVALQGLPFIPELDLEIFLLYLLSRMPSSWESLREPLSNSAFKTWAGAAGVGRALLWWGIKSYLEKNRTTLDEAVRITGDAWEVTMLPDVAGALESDIGEEVIQLIEGAGNPAKAAELRRVRNNLIPSTELFKPLADWLTSFKVSEPPFDLGDWEGLAELTFWSNHLGMSSPVLWNPDDLPVASLPIGTIGHLCLALAEANPEKYTELLQQQGDLLRVRFREETDTLIFKEDDQRVTADFIVPLDLLLSDRQEGANDDSVQGVGPLSGSDEGIGGKGLNSRLNDEAVMRAKLLRYIFPRKDFYCTQGFGHQIDFAGISLPRDSTIKRMPPTAMPIPWLVGINATLHNLEIYRNRPATWRKFAEQLLDIRETIATALLQLHRALVAYFEGGSPRNLFGGTLTLQLWERAQAAAGTKLYLPMSTVDEWGLSSETQRPDPQKKEGVSANIASAFALRRNQILLEAIGDYMSAISNFFNQAGLICSSHGFIGRNLAGRERLLELAKQHGYDENNIGLSIHNLFQGMLALATLQIAYGRRVGSLVTADRLARVTKREKSLFPELWALWYQFCHHPEKRMQSAEVQFLSAMEDALAPARKAAKSSFGSESWRAVVISEKFVWKERRALVLRLDLRKISDLEIARSGVLMDLNTMLKDVELGSLAGYALEYYWHHILVIPALEGVALEAGAWVVPYFVFSGSSDQEGPDRPWLRVLQPLSRDDVAELGLEVSSDSKAKTFNELIKQLTIIQYYFTHWALFAEHIPELDEVGIGILKKYLNKSAQHVSQRFDSLPELIGKVIQEFRPIESIPQELQEAFLEPIERLREELEGSTRQTIDLGECAAKATQFQEVVIAIVALRAMMFPGILEMGESDTSNLQAPDGE